MRCCPEGLALLLTGCAVSPLAARAPALPPCAAAPVDLDLTLAVRLVVGPDITAEAARNLLADGAGALAPWGVRLVVVEEARADAAAAIGGGGDPLDPAHALIIGFGAPGSQHDALVVVVLPHVIDPASPEARGHTLNGLTFAPAGEPLASSIQAQLGVRAPFAPLIVLGKRELDALDPPVAGAIVAHELGHALGQAGQGGRVHVFAVELSELLKLQCAGSLSQTRNGRDQMRDVQLPGQVAGVVGGRRRRASDGATCGDDHNFSI